MAARLNSGETLVAGVAGRPVRHSLSPRIHSAWIAAAGLDAAYVPFPLAEDGFRRFAEGLRGAAVRGVNVTIPFKADALALADSADDLARRAGSANVLVFHDDGRISATNTDGPGMIQALAEAPGLDLTVAPAVVLGAGGAARAAAAALLAAGVPALRIVNRTRARAADLADAFGASAHAWDEMAAAFDGAGVVVNATAAGLKGENPLSGLPLKALPPRAVVLDMVYSPLETALLKEVRAGGRTGIDGLSMLINQARPAFEAFYGMAAPASVDVRALCLEILGAAIVIVLGLTGSIGMGKTTAAGLFAEEGVPVYDADAEVHRLYAPGGEAVEAVEAAFPGVIHEGGVHRGRLGRHVAEDPGALKRLEAIVHPLVARGREAFFEAVRADRAPVVVLDIPLLFETGGERLVDAVVVVSATEDVQRRRVLSRPDMDEAKLAAILARQVPDAEKRARADFLIDTDLGVEAARDEVKRILAIATAPGWRGRRA